MTSPNNKTAQVYIKRLIKSHHRIDVLMMFVLPLFAFVLAFVFRTNLLTSTILFFGLPSIYLSIKNYRAIVKTSIFAFLLSVPATFIIDYLMVRDGAWYIVGSVFPFRLFNVVVIEQFIFSYLWTYVMVSMYEYFFDRNAPFQKERFVSKKMLCFILVVLLIAFFMIGLLLVKASMVVIPYIYILFGITFIFIPLVLFLWHFPHFYRRFLNITLYFFFFAFLVEYVGLSLHQWIFPGFHYIWKIKYLGFSLPIEEVLFYFILSTPGILTYYEYFDDDRK